MMAVIIYYLCAALQRFCRRLSLFMAQHFIDRESEWADAEEVEESVGQDAKYLRLQLIRVRAENTDLRNQTNGLWMKCSEPFHMTQEQLREYACRYAIREADGKTDWLVVVNHCVFCGCDLKTVAFSTERDALLYAALLQMIGYQPKHNLSCQSCYEEYEKSIALSDE